MTGLWVNRDGRLLISIDSLSHCIVTDLLTGQVVGLLNPQLPPLPLRDFRPSMPSLDMTPDGRSLFVLGQNCSDRFELQVWPFTP